MTKKELLDTLAGVPDWGGINFWVYPEGYRETDPFQAKLRRVGGKLDDGTFDVVLEKENKGN